MPGDLRGFSPGPLLGGYGKPANSDMPSFAAPVTRAGGDLRGLIYGPARTLGPQWRTIQGSISQALYPVYGNGIFLSAPSGSFSSIARSADYWRTWTNIPLGSTYEGKCLATNNNGMWLLGLGHNNPASFYLLSYDDGLTWKQLSAPGGSQFYYAAGYSGGYWFLGNYGSATFYRSRDAITWESISMVRNTNCRTFAEDGKGHVWCHGDAQNLIQCSADYGKTWTDGAASSASHFVEYVNGLLFVLAISSNLLYYSSDFGKSFKTATLPSSGTWVRLAYGNGLYVLTKLSSSDCVVSVDGLDWQAAQYPATAAGVVFGGGVFAAVAGSLTSGWAGTL